VSENKMLDLRSGLSEDEENCVLYTIVIRMIESTRITCQ